MSPISTFLKIDYFCHCVVSSATDLVGLFQKYVFFPLVDKSKAASTHCYKHLDQKNICCFLLVIPVVGIIVGIYDFSKKKHGDKIDRPNISLDDVESIVVDGACAQSWPCQHHSVVVLKDGGKASPSNSYQICSIISSIAEEKINPGKAWGAKEAKNHFSKYSKPRPSMGWKIQSAEEVLKNIFLQNN